MRALVVDDSAEVRTRIVSLLHELERFVAIYEAAGADEALALAASIVPNVVILDLHMPAKSGLLILTSLRSLPSPPLIVVLTNDPTEHHRRQSLASGAHFFFDKSKDLEAVLAVLRSPLPTRHG